jgi:hypothetical protein
MKASTIFVYPIEGRVDRLLESGVVRKNVGSLARKNGHLTIGIDGKTALIHRLIYTHFHGPIPPYLMVDHINGIPTDNRIENLRLVSPSQNKQNTQKAYKNSKTGVKGVCFEKGFFRVVIYSNRVKHELGRYKNREEAINAYAQGAKKFHTHNPTAKI